MGARPSLWVVVATIFIDMLCFGLIIPVLPYYALAFHASETEVTLLGSAFSAMQFLMVPFWGRLSDRIGRKPVMLASILGTTIAMAMFGAAQSLAWLFAARLLAGAMTANIAVAHAYIADVTSKDGRARGMGMMGAALGLGFIIGPFTGGLLAKLGHSTGIGHGLVGYGAAAIALCNFVFAVAVLRESRPREIRELDADGHGSRGGRLAQARVTFAIAGVAALVLVFFVYTLAFSSMEWTFALLTRARLGWTEDAGGPEKNGYVFAAVGAIQVTVNGGLIGPLARRFGEKRLLEAGLALVAIGMATLATMHGLVGLAISLACLASGGGLVLPCVSALVSRRAPPDRQGSVLGIQQSGGALARMIGPAIGGVLFEHAGPSWPYVVATAVLAIALGTTVARVPAADA